VALTSVAYVVKNRTNESSDRQSSDQWYATIISTRSSILPGLESLTQPRSRSAQEGDDPQQDTQEQVVQLYVQALP
jgi:hypothetical protein